MTSLPGKRWAAATGLGLLALGLSRAPVPAQQFRAIPAVPNPAAYQAGAARGALYGYGAGFRSGAIADAYYGAGAYSPYYYNPYGGFMSGVADVNSSIYQGMIQQEQAGVVREQKKQAQIDTRRKSFDEWLYERDARPTVEDERERARIENIRRSRNDPPLNEIWSGTALNRLLVAIQQMIAQKGPGPSVPLDTDLLKRINVTSGGVSGNIGLLRDGGKLRWPVALQDTPYDEDRKALDDLARTAYQQAAAGNVTAATIRGMTQAVDRLDALLTDHVADMTPGQYGPAKGFLRELKTTIRGLQDPNVANYASQKWAARGNSVFELVDEMTRLGLKFAPATRGDEGAYVAVHAAMVAYYSGPDPSKPWDPLAK